MTDLELTRLCGAAMGLQVKEYNGNIVEWASVPHVEGAWRQICVYRPLHDDAQCFALVKKFPIQCIEAMWTYIRAFNPAMMAFDLNHAICESVAKMQEEK